MQIPTPMDSNICGSCEHVASRKSHASATRLIKLIRELDRKRSDRLIEIVR